MNNKTRNLIHLLAASGFSDNEVYEALRNLSERPPGYWMELLMVIRQDIRNGSYRLLYEEANPKGQTASRTLTDSVGERVEKLLKIEAGLGTSEAVRQLGERLIESGLISKSEIPPLSRKSLGDWAIRVSRRVPAKEILRHATLIRNVYARRPKADWKLG